MARAIFSVAAKADTQCWFQRTLRAIERERARERVVPSFSHLSSADSVPESTCSNRPSPSSAGHSAPSAPRPAGGHRQDAGVGNVLEATETPAHGDGRQNAKEDRKWGGVDSLHTFCRYLTVGLCSTCCAHLARGTTALCAHHVPVFPRLSLAPK